MKQTYEEVEQTTNFSKQGACCVAGDTLITMADGRQIEIDRIRIGDYIFNSDFGAIHVVNTMRAWEEKLWNITTNNVMDIKTTGNHPFMTRNGIKIACELTEEDELLLLDGAYSKVKSCVEEEYKNFVYNLCLGEEVLFFANNYAIGDFEMQERMEWQRRG